MEADISGPQRTVMTARVHPVKAAHGDSGLALRDGHTVPFVVERAWLAPIGYYEETWYLVDPQTREVLYEGPKRVELIFGLQALTRLADTVTEPLALTRGRYLIVFALGGLKGGEVEMEAFEMPSEEAA